VLSLIIPIASSMGAALSPARRYCAHMVTAADAGNFPVFHHKRQIYSCSRAVRLKKVDRLKISQFAFGKSPTNVRLMKNVPQRPLYAEVRAPLARWGIQGCYSRDDEAY
jgi:hypothetical protein